MANSPILGIPLLSESQAAKEVTINQAISFLEKSMNDDQTISFSGGNVTLPLIDLQRYFIFRATGVSVNRILTVPNTMRIFAVDNTAGAANLTVTRDVNSVVLGPGTTAVIYVSGSTIKMLWYSDNGGTINFTALGDTPANYTGEALKYVRVNAAENGLEFVTAGDQVSDFIDLDDTPAAYTGAAGYAVVVNETADGLEFVPLPAGSFIGQDDTPAAYTDQALKYVRVNATEDGLEFVNAGDMISSFIDLDDVPADYGSAAGFFLRVKEDQTGIEFYDPSDLGMGGGGGATNFFDLEDVPAEYTGAAGYFVRVNATEDGLVFSTAGDMITSFVDLDDVPASYEGFGGAMLRVNEEESAIEFLPLTSINIFADVEANAAEVGQSLIWDGSQWIASYPGMTINSKTDNYILLASDAGKYIRMNKATAVTLTVPANADVPIPVSSVISVRQVGAGQVTIVAASGVTITTPETLKLRKQHSSATLVKVGTNTWELTGDLEILP